MKFLDLNGVSILWRRIKETFARKSETVSDISRDDTTFTVTKADGTTFEFTQKDTTYDVATTTSSGLMSATDKAKLNGVESGAQPNVIESVSVNGTEQSVTAKGIDITVPTALSDLTDDVGYLTEESDPTVPTWAKQPQKPAYTASEVGALPADTHIPTDVSELNNDAGYLTEHQDISGIEDAIARLTTKLNALADSDDTTLDQLSEIVAYIKNNKSLIDGITTGKVSVDDIVNNLTSTVANKPLSAKQGKVLKDMIDSIVVPTKVSQLTNDAGYLTEHQDISGKANVADLSAVATSGSYADLSNKPTIPTVPTKVSAFTNDANYTNEKYVDDAITAALADVVGIEYHVCTTAEYDAQTYIPTLAGEAGVIYLVPKPASLIGSAVVGTDTVSGNNIYYEFIYNGRSFEMIGDTQVSLEGYLEDSDVSTDAQVQSVITEVFGGA